MSGKIIVNTRLEPRKHVLDIRAAHLSARGVKVTSPAHLLKHELNIYTSARTRRDHDLSSRLDKHKGSVHSTNGKQLVGGLGGCDAIYRARLGDGGGVIRVGVCG